MQFIGILVAPKSGDYWLVFVDNDGMVTEHHWERSHPIVGYDHIEEWKSYHIRLYPEYKQLLFPR